MALQHLADMEGAVEPATGVLAAGGTFCAPVVHPLNSAVGFATHEPDTAFEIEDS